MSELKTFYEGYWKRRLKNEDISKVTVNRAKTIVSFFDDKQLGKTLDVGCGDGTLLYTISKDYKYKLKPYGIEISKDACKMAATKKINVKNGDVEKKLPYIDQSFDTIICSEVLEHLVFPERTLSEIKRIAKKDTTVILTVPNIGYIKNRLKLLIGKSPFEQGRYSSVEHLHFWTKKAFIDLLEEIGFKIIDAKGAFGRKIGVLSNRYPSLLSDTLYVKIKKV